MLTNRNPSSHFDEATSIFDLLFVKNPYRIEDNKPIFISGEEILTFGEIRKLILKCSYNLQKRFNIQNGDVVAIRSLAHIQYPLILHGTLCAGATIALVKCSPEDSIETVAQDLNTVKPKLFIIENDGSRVSIEAAYKAGIPRSNILILGDTNIEGILKTKDVLLSGDTFAEPYSHKQHELVCMTSYLFFTSGSTGKRKAVKATTKAMLTSLNSSAIGEQSYKRLLGNKPFSFLSSITNDLHMSILFGYKVFISRAVTIDEICSDIEKYKINHLLGSPYILTQMAKESSTHKYELSSLQGFVSIGSVLAKQTIRLIKNRFKVDVQNNYGATEFFGPFINTLELSEMGALGHLNPKYTFRLVDANGNDVKCGEPGELLVKGPTVTSGYYNNPEATAEAFTEDGFYCSGDIFTCDENGVFWFKSRAKNLMKFQSTHIYPCDIEKVLVTHPKVSDCGVIGIYSEELSTDLPRAYVTLINKEDYLKQENVAKEILDYTNKHLHENKHIREGIVIIKEFPRTDTGKILYGKLKEFAEKERMKMN